MPTSTSETKAEKLSLFVKAEAKRLGFADCRILRAVDAEDHAAVLSSFLEARHHGTMGWMAETADRRASPRGLWPDVKSIIVLTINYGPQTNPLETLDKPDCGSISVYARNRDYHDIVKGKLKELAGKLASRTKADVKVFVDTAPVMEKPLAAKAGLGWQGKHTNLVSREFGSWLFIGSIFTEADLGADEGEIDHCGSCRACLDACPTGAFPEPYRIDARRCISYLTIEHKGPIELELRRKMGNRIYGCDDCLAACPWNKFAACAQEMKLIARDELNSPKLDFLLQFDDAIFRRFFSGSPIKRIGRNRFIRNCLIAAGNSGLRDLIAPVRQLCRDESAEVRAMALWAIHMLKGLGTEELAALLPDHEDDQLVLNELRLLETNP